MPVKGGLGQQVQKVVKLNNGSGGLITQANKPCMLSEEQVQLLYIVSPGGTNHQKQRYENMAYPSGYDMEWVQFLIQWPQQPMREPMLLLRTQWFGRVSTLHIYIYISHRDKSEVQGGNKGSGGTSHGRVAAPTHPRNQTTVGQTSLPVHQKQPEDSNKITSINSSVYIFSFFFFGDYGTMITYYKKGGNSNTV